MRLEDSFFSKVQRRKAGWLCSLNLVELQPPGWYLLWLPAKANVLIELGVKGMVFCDSLPYSWPSSSQPKLYFLVPLSGLQTRSSWIIWLAFSQNREPPSSVYFPVSEGGGPRMGRLLGLLLKQKPPQIQSGFAKSVSFPTSGRHLLSLCTLSTLGENYFQMVLMELFPLRKETIFSL
jgi:hypothetical protein